MRYSVAAERGRWMESGKHAKAIRVPADTCHAVPTAQAAESTECGLATAELEAFPNLDFWGSFKGKDRCPACAAATPSG